MAAEDVHSGSRISILPMEDRAFDRRSPPEGHFFESHDDVAATSRDAAHCEREERNAVSYIESTLGKLIVTVPDTGGDRFNVVVIYGGQHYANRSWMQKQTPAEIMDKVICVFAEYTMAYATVITQHLGPFLAAKELKATGVAGRSIMGF